MHARRPIAHTTEVLPSNLISSLLDSASTLPTSSLNPLNLASHSAILMLIGFLPGLANYVKVEGASQCAAH